MFKNLAVGRVPLSVSASYSFHQILAGYIKQVQKHFFKTAPDKEPKRYLNDLLNDHSSAGTKGLRPGLCLATTIALGGTNEMALPSAMTLECLHNVFAARQEVTTANGIALKVDDAMNVLSMGVLSANEQLLGMALSRKVFREFYHLIIESAEGQGIEAAWARENRFNLTEQDYLQMVLKKTCWYTSTHPVRIGALIASEGKVNPDRFNNFGYQLGAAFQVQNDILNLSTSTDAAGNEIPSDIREGRRTLMLIHLHNRLTRFEQQKLQKYFLLPERDKDPVTAQEILNMMNECGSIEYAKSRVRQMSAEAMKEFNSLFSFLPESAEKRFIEDLVHYMTERGGGL
jgi:geranylgeranyl diphosphate synthase type II